VGFNGVATSSSSQAPRESRAFGGGSGDPPTHPPTEGGTVVNVPAPGAADGVPLTQPRARAQPADQGGVL
jgi:hypothetical protein